MGKIIRNEIIYGGSADEASAVVYDPTSSGLSATNVQDAIDEVADSANISYDNTSSGLSSTNVQNAIDEVLSAIYYTVGDTYAPNGDVSAFGFTTGSGKQAYITFTIPKQIDGTITGATISVLKGTVRTSDGGYLDGNSSATYDWVSNYTVSISSVYDNVVRVRLVSSNTFSNAPNNSPIIYHGQISVTFT